MDQSCHNWAFKDMTDPKYHNLKVLLLTVITGNLLTTIIQMCREM